MDDRDIIGRFEYVQLLVWVVVLAVPVALLTLLYLTIYKQGILFYESLAETLNIPRPFFTIIVATLGGLLVGLGLRYLGVHHGKSLQAEMEEGKIPYRGLPGLIITALVGLVSGASVGPEGPLGHMGAGIGSWFADRREYSAEKSRILSLSGIASAFGGYMVSPLPGAFMSMEFTGQLTVPIYANLIASTVAGLIGAWVIFGISGAPIPGSEGFSAEGVLHWSGIIYAVIFGLVGLVWSFLFKFIFGGTRRLAGSLDHFPLLKPVAGGLVFGLVGAALPLTLFSGEEELTQVLEHGAEIGVVMLIFLSVVKLFTLSICLATGFPGGFVFPLFFSAGALGYAIHLMIPFIPLPICMIGVIAGVGGAVMRMPFTVILLLMLLTNPTLLPVSTFSAVTSYLAAGILDAGSARKAMRQAGDKRRELYLGEKEARNASAL